LSDADEAGTYFTDPTERDSDGDGVTDLGEALGTRTDPNDPSSTIDPGDFFVVLQYMGMRE
ncbi:MAG: OmpA family protein, partial [Actinobacteria bacterium]|nr:OmpA family protein [Actinomycetota bacterium]NIS37321.1 OmpA family protein [Actinomycetota bacterium]